MQAFKNKSVWIIGASQGIGLALAKKLHDLDYDLVLSSRSLMDLQVLNDSFTKKAELLALDVTDYDKFYALTESLFKKHSFDYIFYFPGYYEPGSLTDLSLDIIHATLDVNLKSVVYLLKLILPYLKKTPACQLLVTSSVAGYIGLPRSQPYSACKAAVINLMESVKAENPDCGLRLIVPGFVKTRLTDKNNFTMPAIISSDLAAEYIIHGLSHSQFEIHFPKKLSVVLKIMKMIPYRLYFYLVKKYVRY